MEIYNLSLMIRPDIEKTSLEEDIAYVNQFTNELIKTYVDDLNVRKRMVELITSAHLKGADIREYKRKLGNVDVEIQILENDLIEFLAFENRLKQTQTNKSQEEK